MTPDDVERIITEVAAGTRELSEAELQEVLKHIAAAGFHPTALERVRTRVHGIPWRGRVLGPGDRLPPADNHYVWHVVVQQEWPAGTTLPEYVESIRAVILDPTSGVFINRYQGALSLGVLRESRGLRGPGGFRWLLVQYRGALEGV